MHVLVTRPEADAREIRARLEALGHRVSVAPLIEIAPQPVTAEALEGVAGLIATSRNAIAALVASPALSTAIRLPIFTVGAATAKRARDAGFQSIIAGPRAAAELISTIAADPLARAGRLIHLAGDHLAGDIAGPLLAAGVEVQPLVVYRSIAAKSLPAAVETDLNTCKIDAVILMSPRTARTWRDLAAPTAAEPVTHLCLSAAVAAALTDTLRPAWRAKINVAAAPTMEEVLALVQRLASQSAAR